MTFTVHAERTVAGDRLILMGAGDVRAQAKAAARLDAITPSWRDTNPPGAIELDLTWPAVVQLANEYGPAWRPGPHLVEWIGNEVARRTQPLPTTLSFDVPDGLEPMEHQVSGAHLAALTGGGRIVLWDDRRTGKTITAILALQEMHATWAPHLGTPQQSIIVICPSAAVLDWCEAFALWWPQVACTPWLGDAERRRRRAGGAGVYVVSWGTIGVDAQDKTKKRSPLMHLRHAALVVDEAHRAKNPTAARTLAMARLARPASIFLALTGSPIAHSIKDLQPTIQFLHPGTPAGGGWLPAKDRMVERWAYTGGDKGYGEPDVMGLSERGRSEFHLCMLGQWRWTNRDDVLDEPPKVHVVREVELPAEWRRVYDEVEALMLAELPDGGELPSFGVLAQLQQLVQLTNSACDVEITETFDEETGEPKKHYHMIPKLPCWKIEDMLTWLDARRGEHSLIFAPHAKLIRLAGPEIERELGLRIGYMIGGQSYRRRHEIKGRFQAGELDVMCCTTGAGSEAITLHRATGLYYLQRPWSGIESAQSEDRASGIGAFEREQTDVADCVARNTVDSRVREALYEKGGQMAELVRDPRVVAAVLGGASVTTIKPRRTA